MERKATTVFQAFTDARYKKNFGSFSYVMEEKKEEEKVGVDTNRGLFFFIYIAGILDVEIIVCQNHVFSWHRTYYPIIVPEI